MRRHPSSRPWLRSVAAVLGLAGLVGLPGCGLFDGDQADPPRALTTLPTTTTAPQRVEVLDPGEAPRRALRLRLREGATTTVDLRVDLAVSQTEAGSVGAVAVDTPAVIERVRFTIDRVDDGGADVTFEFLDANLDRAGTDLTDQEYVELTAAVQRLIGLGGTGRVTDRGNLRSLSYDRPATLDPSVAAALDEAEGQFATLALPLPAEPLGVGARWRTTARATRSGVAVDQATTYELTALDGDQVSFRADITQTGAAQDLDLTGLDAGTSARLVSSEVIGTATGTMALDSLAAASTSELTGSQVVALRSGNEPAVEVTQRLEIAVTVAPVG